MKQAIMIAVMSMGCASKLSDVNVEDAAPVSESMAGDEFYEALEAEGSTAEPPPLEVEICDGEDNDGDGEVDEGLLLPFYVDEDGDGWGAERVEACTQPEGTAEVSGDCDDTNAEVHPEATETCNDIDDDCDTDIDEGLFSTFFEDGDDDGYGNPAVGVMACAPPEGFVENSDDCDDTNSLVSPETTEVCNGIDDNCDSRVDEGVGSILFPDRDGDGYGDSEAGIISCWDMVDYIDRAGDCDDAAADVNPDAVEACDGVDNDCDGAVDEHAVLGLVEFFVDVDGDGHGTGDAYTGCEVPDGFSSTSDDCDDLNVLRAPSLTETCDGLDNDCDGSVDEDVMSAFYMDADGDGWGAGDAVMACDAPPGAVSTDADCDDTRSETFPGAPELCDDQDNDCNDEVDDEPVDGDTFYDDSDGDGFGDPEGMVTSCERPSGYVASSTDCDPESGDTYPGAPERCDDEDNDCDGVTDEDPVDPLDWFRDLDGDSYGDPDDVITQCDAPLGYVAASGDCDDGLDSVFPGAEEYCNDTDDDCDGDTDEDPVDGDIYYFDDDRDGYGSDSSMLRCDGSTDWVENDDDCNDDDDEIYPGATEDCDGQDQDCDDIIDNDADCRCDQFNWSGSSYMFCDDRKRWHEARDLCEEDGYTLATVNSYAEQVWILDIIRGDYGIDNEPHWIGLNDRTTERWGSRTGWVWRSGEPYSYQAWASSPYYQPDNWGGAEDCVEVNRWEDSAPWNDWNDLSCSNRIRYICEAR